MKETHMPTVPSNMIAPTAGDPVAQDGAPAMESAFAGPRQARGVAPADGQVGERGPAIDHLLIEWSAVSPDRATPGLPAERAPPLASPLPQIQHESVGRRTPRGLRRSDDRLGSCPTGERSDRQCGPDGEGSFDPRTRHRPTALRADQGQARNAQWAGQAFQRPSPPVSDGEDTSMPNGILPEDQDEQRPTAGEEQVRAEEGLRIIARHAVDHPELYGNGAAKEQDAQPLRNHATADGESFRLDAAA